MKGGYQIINLSGTTAGDPVTVPGIYNIAKENHEKAVMLYTPDSQRVFSQIKKVDGVYKTTYLSAEGNVVMVEIAANDAVTTTITNPTSSIVGLEVAVNDLSETKANRADVASISIDGNYNDTGETIPAGTFLYLNNELIKTTAAVLDEGEFIESGEGANYTVDTVGDEVTQLNNKIKGEVVATAAANQTYQQQLDSLYSYYSALTSEQKQNAYLYTRDTYFRAAGNYGEFSGIEAGSADFIITCFRIRLTGSFARSVTLTASGNTVAGLASDTNTNEIKLIVAIS